MHLFCPCQVCTFIAHSLCSLYNIPPLNQTVKKTMAAIASCHRSCWKLLIKHSILLVVLTPRNRLIYPHFVHDIIDLHYKQVKVDSLHEHPAECYHQKILQKSRHCNTAALHKRVVHKTKEENSINDNFE